MTPTNKQPPPYWGGDPFWQSVLNPTQIKDKGQFVGNVVAAPFAGMIGAGDYLTHLASALGGRPASQVMGLSANLQDRLSGTPTPDAGGFQEAMQDKLTYKPRTGLGQTLQESPYNPINVIGKGLHNVSDWAGSFGEGEAADTPIGMLSNAVSEATMHLAGILGAKYTGSKSRAQELADDAAAIKVRNQNLSITEQAIENAKSNGFTVPPQTGIAHQIAGTVKTNPVASRYNTVRATELIAEELGLKVKPKLDRNVTGTVKKQNVTGKDKWTGGIDTDALTSLKAKHSAVYTEVTNTLIKPTKGVVVKQIKVPQVYRDTMKAKYNKLKSYVDDLGELSGRKFDVVLGDLLKESKRVTMKPQNLLDRINNNRASAKSHFKKGAEHNLKKGESDLMIANNLEKVMETHLKNSNKPNLHKKWENSSLKLAQINVAEAALNTGTGLINPKVIAKIHKDKPKYLTGNLKGVGEFANAFPEINGYFATAPTRIGFFDTVVAGFSLAAGKPAWAVAEITGRSIIPSLMVRKGKVGLRNEPTLSLKSRYKTPYGVGQAATYAADLDEISKFNEQALGRITKDDKITINQKNIDIFENATPIYKE